VTSIRLDSLLRRWLETEDGTVTVDFVVLTAALATLGLVAFSVIRPGVHDLSSDISDELTGILN